MDFSEAKKFMVLLWKNFILKRRRCIALVVEMVLTFLFSAALLAVRSVIVIKKNGPFDFAAQPVDEVPFYVTASLASAFPLELAYVPSRSTVVQGIVERVKMDLNPQMKVLGFSTEEEFEDYVKEVNNSEKVLAAIVFDHDFKNSNDPLPLKVKYYLRFSNEKKSNMLENIYEEASWLTDFLFPPIPSVGPRNQDEDGGSPGYISEGFLFVQHSLDKAIMQYHSGQAAEMLFSSISVYVQRFPYPSYYHDFFFMFSGVFIPLVLVCIFSLNHLTLVQSLVWEKENRLKVKPAPVIQSSDPTLIVIFLLFYAIATICFSFMVSTLFSKVNIAVALGGLFFFAIYFPAAGLHLYYGKMTFIQKLAACLSSNFAMALGVKFLADAETWRVGLKWSNIFSSTTLDNFYFAHVLGMFLFDAFLYSLVAWYIEAVFPGSYGVPKPWNFFLQCSYWFVESPEKKTEVSQFYEQMQSKYFEAEPTDLRAGIQIKHLCKVFQMHNTTKVAVNDLSLNLYEGQITVLLGHNGAGKSTTLSILSGLYPPTSGNAYINGYSISKQMVQIRKSLGLCPQQNLLFNYLTVSEHLHFYSVIKGVHGKMTPTEIDRMLATFNLLEKRNKLSKSLSGGMKRKLSIIIALIGGSKVVILDEPTSGMDPVSRRVTWDLLQHFKLDRTILLTTHYMDEADVLGDRIAIMVKGSVRCCGSSIFLKKIYGVGYRIVMVKTPDCNVEEVSKLIHYYIPTATLENDVGTELSFILPKNYAHSFEALFTALEQEQENLGISSVGASVTTMEEVFFKVGYTEESQTDIEAMKSSSQMGRASNRNQNKNMSRNVEGADPPTLNESPTINFNTGCSLYSQQFCAMFVKRVMFNWRNWKLLLLQILGLIGSLAFLLSSSKNSSQHEMIRQMELSQYGQTIVPFSISGASNLTADLSERLKSMLESDNQRPQEVQGDLLKYLRETKDCIRLCIIALSIESEANMVMLTALFNNEAYHSPSVALAVLDNILFKSLSGANASLTVSNKPQPLLDIEENEELQSGQKLAINLQFGMALLINGFCLLTVTERTTKAKHIQFVSGVSVIVYWLSALLCDFIIFFASCCLVMGVIKYHKLDIYVTDYHILETMLIFTLYGWSAIPFVYLISFVFSGSTSAYIKLLLLSYFSGTFGFLIGEIIENNTEKNIYSLEEPMIGKYLIDMSTAGFIFLVLIFFWETTSWRLRTFLNQYIYFGIYKRYRKEIVSKELSGQSEDEDVQNERKRILEQPQELLDSIVLIKELIKIYFKCPAILAVKNISLAIQKGECFGLLGFNGAGKTTTFQILTGEASPTSGDVLIDGFSITKDILQVRSRIGYCPQFDALLEYMTAQEIMIMYARIWGVSEPQIKLYVNKWLNSLELESHADRLISTYSEGNKRRLSTAIALMGRSSIIFLDEPSTGMDPVARRLLWNIVTKTRESGKAIVITSHSMEECDALCTSLAIMVQGKFMCLGSPQHLKNKFGNIYILKVKVKTKDKLEDFKRFVITTFPGVRHFRAS
ncbi:PREDICTED: ATP-binding cassette sub-family A member 3-like isoform X5 [Cercocebus atys]|uniref:ATP-binding cassette sub-family A member 3-like isoform X5 n=1 Tax=Cercocebus atys TaxID=9531 RepID=UPI0005F445E2|nr:PREDICTED: ATP-binding cassette sub-family A member 3-like isoform X5 [Cercocebus atys]